MADQPTRVTLRSAATTAGVTSAALLLAAAAAMPAFADGDNSDSAHSNQGNHYGQSKTHSNNGSDGASADSTGHNPPGNNGTVKIHDDYGDTAHHNVPHVDCDFAVAFWGFDVAQTLNVSFAGQAPTGKDTPLTVTGAATSITSPDDAGGGQDYDGELDFSADQLDLASLGDPHPKQGYHVKLTVDTGEPGGHKYKVFWLQPCATAAPATQAGTETETSQSQAPTQSDTETPANDVIGESLAQPATAAGNNAEAATTSQTAADTPTSVLGQHFSRASSAAAPSAASLPFTGAEIGGMAAAAAIALAAGAALTVAGRRRRAGSVSES